MKIAIDKEPLISGHKVRGIGVHTKELVDALKKYSKGTQIKLADFKKENLSKYDIIHFPYFHPFFETLPKDLGRFKKTVVTIHDLIPLIYPRNFPPGIKGKLRFMSQKKLVKNVDAVITISETSKKDIVRFLDVPEEKVYPIHLAPRSIFNKVKDKKRLLAVKKKYHLPEKFVLYVGDINYNKNILNLIEAVDETGVNLVICGKQASDIDLYDFDIQSLTGPRDWLRFLFGLPHPEVSHYKAILEKVRVSRKVMRLGFVAEDDLVSIYNLATVYCQPSLYEGFGLPILEAMACGTPVVASRIQAHVEIARDSVLYADPKSAGDLSVKIRKVLGDKKVRDGLIKKGLANSRNYSWQKTAEKTINVYKSL